MISILRPGLFRRCRRFVPLASVAALLASNGSATAAWQTGGTPLTPVPGYLQSFALQSLLADGEGGAFTVWLRTDDASEFDRYRLSAQRVNVSGNRPSPWLQAGSSVWPEDESFSLPRTLALVPTGAADALHVHLTDYNSSQRTFQMYRVTAAGSVEGVPGYSGLGGGDVVSEAAAAADGAGGVLAAQLDLAGTLRTKRIDGSGATVWGPVVLTSSAAPLLATLADGSGGAFVAWASPGAALETFVQHLDAGGAIATGWPAGGVALGELFPHRLGSDGAGGVFVLGLRWDQGSESRVRVHHVLANGTKYPGIPDGGRELPDSEAGHSAATLVADGQGGAYVARLHQPFFPPVSTIRLYHFGAAIHPIPGWPSNGIPLTSQSTQNSTVGLLADGAGGAYVSFRHGVGPAAPRGLYAQHFEADGAIASGWPAAPGYRLSDTGEASALVRSGSGVLVAWTDTRLSRQGVYAQRLDLDTDALAVDDPHAGAAIGLALETPRPNPTRQGVTLVLVLPNERPARIDVLDLAGRRVASRDLAALGAGRHLVRLEEVEAFAPGLYVVQLTHGGDSRRARLLRVP